MHSAQEMARGALELLRDPERRQQLGREGRQQVLREHNWDDIADQYEKLYASPDPAAKGTGSGNGY